MEAEMDGWPGEGWALPAAVSEVLNVAGWGYERGYTVFRGELKLPAAAAAKQLRSRLAGSGMLAFFSREKDGVVIRCGPGRVRRGKDRWLLPLALFAFTLASTLAVGALMSGCSAGALLARPVLLWRGAPFSFALLGILVGHEFSHYFFSRKHGIKTSLPYFIPFPNILGTMGAVIISRSPFPDRKSLFDVGVAGPLAGFLLALGAIGLGFSEMSLVRTRLSPLVLRPGLYLGDSLLTTALFHLRFGPIPEGYEAALGPIGFAGWVGLFVTGLNLIPMGQLDGGHIAYSVFGRRQKLITWGIIGALAVFGVAWSSPFWILIAGLIALFGRRHGPPLDDITPLDPFRLILAAAAFLILAACFIPVPIRVV